MGKLHSVLPGLMLGGRYRLDERVRFDIEAHVWRGFDTELGRTVGVRLPSHHTHTDTLESFPRQFRILSMIDHPGVIGVFDIGLDPSVLTYLVIEHLEWRPLLPNRLLTVPEAMDMVAQAADALQAVHACDVVYRNVRKGLMMRPDHTVVLDGFHYAHPVGAPQLGHFANSDAGPVPATALTDIYELGMLAYFCLTKRRRSSGIDREIDLPWPDSIPPAVRAVVDTAAALNPAQRWPTAAAMAQAARDQL